MTTPKPPSKRILPPSKKASQGRYAPLLVVNASIEHESVEAFLARGGQVERLDAGDRSTPLQRSLRDRKAEEFKISAPQRTGKRP